MKEDDWVGHVTRTGEVRNGYGSLVQKHEVEDHLEDLGIDGG
jgi:hypothetical protein